MLPCVRKGTFFFFTTAFFGGGNSGFKFFTDKTLILRKQFVGFFLVFTRSKKPAVFVYQSADFFVIALCLFGT